MKLIEAIKNNCGHYLTSDQIFAKLYELNMDPNSEVAPGDKIKFGSMTFTVYDDGGMGRKLLKTAMDQPTKVVCPTCNGTGEIDESN